MTSSFSASATAFSAVVKSERLMAPRASSTKFVSSAAFSSARTFMTGAALAVALASSFSASATAFSAVEKSARLMAPRLLDEVRHDSAAQLSAYFNHRRGRGVDLLCFCHGMFRPGKIRALHGAACGRDEGQ
ncbi:MAG: hypothetical protein PSV46_16945 [Reyranella sp.]|nr:hypothetical protein [Reyranella sp.]